MCVPSTSREKEVREAQPRYLHQALFENEVRGSAISFYYRHGKRFLVQFYQGRSWRLVQDHDNGKWECLRRTAMKLALWPFTILLGIWDALSHVAYEEPLDYRAAPSGVFTTALGDERM